MKFPLCQKRHKIVNKNSHLQLEPKFNGYFKNGRLMKFCQTEGISMDLMILGYFQYVKFVKEKSAWLN